MTDMLDLMLQRGDSPLFVFIESSLSKTDGLRFVVTKKKWNQKTTTLRTEGKPQMIPASEFSNTFTGLLKAGWTISKENFV